MADVGPGIAAAPTAPFFLAAGEVGCLLIHGFTGTPYEMRFLGEHLAAAGYSVCGVRLAGHATRVEDLAERTWREWYRSAEEGFAELSRRCSKVVAVGLSMGALLAVELASRRASEVSGVVLLSAAFELASPWPSRLAGITRLVLPSLPERLRYLPKGGSDIADPFERERRPAYDRIPLQGIAELVDLQRRAKARLASVAQPALAVHARQDHTAPLSNLRLVREGMRNLRKAVILEDSYHVITVDREKERVAAEVSGFVGDVCKAQAVGETR